MNVEIESPFAFHLELRSKPDAEGTPFHHESISGDLEGLVTEAFVRGVLEEELPPEPPWLSCRITPVWKSQPVVKEIEIELVAGGSGEERRYSLRFASGGWVRRALRVLTRLREERALGESDLLYPVVFAESDGAEKTGAPLLSAPPIVDGTLGDFGVQTVGEGELVPDRPILLNRRAHDEIIDSCTAAGANETGGALLGQLVRLAAPLPGTRTRIVTVLSTHVSDERHVGSPGAVRFAPEALVDAEKIAAMRGYGERVLSVAHSHGWGTTCQNNCNQNAGCPLTECTRASVLDYELLESMFPCKSALLPIAGRKLGVEKRSPVLAVHAWRGGELLEMRWKKYDD